MKLAKINGFEVKGVKTFSSLEGPISQGKLYFKGKRVGEFETDNHGGPMNYYHDNKNISEKEVLAAFNEIPEKYGWTSLYSDMDVIIEELIQLKQFESIFKKGKDGVLIVCDIDKTKDFETLFNPAYYLLKKGHEPVIETYVNKLKKDYPKGNVTIYKSLDDFNI